MTSILNDHFYHQSIRTYTAVFGSLFSNVKIKRPDGKLIKVPLSYASRQRFDYFDQTKKDPHVKANYPRMGFVLTSWQRDQTRLKNRNHLISENIDLSQKTTTPVQYNRVPFNFFYDLHIATKNIDDMFQIMEQISVMFNPSLDVIVKDNQDLNIDESISIVLDSTSFEDEYEGDYEEADSKIVRTTMPFKVEGHLYMPTLESGVVNSVTINYYDLDTDFLIDTQTIEAGNE